MWATLSFLKFLYYIKIYVYLLWPLEKKSWLYLREREKLTKKLFFCTNVFKWKIFSEGSKQFLTLYFNFEPFIACMYTKKRRKNSTKHTQKNQFKKCVEKMQTPGYNSVSTVFLTSQTSNSITKLTLLHTSSQLFAWKEDYFISWCPLTRYQHQPGV